MKKYKIEVTNDGNGIYINNLLVDDFDRLPEYYKGYDFWYSETKKI